MTDTLRTSEARKHQRFAVKKGTFVIVSPGTDKERKVQVIDISQGGTAFIYHGDRKDLETSGVLTLLAKDASLGRVGFETVSDQPVTGPATAAMPARRRGVKFLWMGIVEKADLRDFVRCISA